MKLLENKVAIITGAARGIGRALAIKYAHEGASLALIVRQNDENSKSIENEITKLDVKVKCYVCNVANFDEVHTTIKEIVNDFGKVDILINNAGITKDTLMMRMNEQQWDDVINTNLKSAFNFSHAIIPVMMKQKSGSIINMSSVVGLSGNAGQTNYAASKAGMIGLTKSLAKEIGSRGIRSNAICPGFIETDMTSVLTEDLKKKWEEQIPLRRAGNTDDVANLAIFLGSDMSTYITGQAISICGGMEM